MNDLVSNGIPRSMIYYQRRKRESEYDADLEKRISHIVTERPSYGTGRVTAMIRRSGIRVGRNRIRRHMRHMNLIATHKKAHRNQCAQDNSCCQTKCHVGDGFHKKIHRRRRLCTSYSIPGSPLKKDKGTSCIENVQDS